MNTIINSNISSSLESASRIVNLGVESLGSHISVLNCGASKDMLSHVKLKMLDYVERINTKVRFLEIHTSHKSNLSDSLILMKDKQDIKKYISESEITLSALYNLQAVYKELEKLLLTCPLDTDSYLIIYDIIDCIKTDYRYLKSAVFVCSTSI